MKNFFHDISDILLALFIVIVCAGVIFWRMNIIMQYPETLVGDPQTEQTDEASADAAEDTSAETTDEATTAEATTDSAATDTTDTNEEPVG